MSTQAPTQNRSSAFEFDVIGRDAYALHDHRGRGIGSVVVPSIWLAFYLIAAVHSYLV